jgi:hypothetical protein
VTPVQTAIVILTFARSLVGDASTIVRPSEPLRFFEALGLVRPSEAPPGPWSVAEQSPPFAWMIEAGPLPSTSGRSTLGPAESFQQILDHMSPALIDERSTHALPGVVTDPGRWRYQVERSGGLYKRKTKLELPDPSEVWIPYVGRDWKAQEKVQIPVPLPLPVAEQLFVYGQLDGSGDALNNQQTSLYGKTGVGLKWSLPARSELQLRYATLFSYADELSVGRFQERAQPAVELNARLPLFGPLELEYTGSAIAGTTRTDNDQFRQELRLAMPLRGDNELEFGARYRWEPIPTPSPWVDRAQLFLGVRIRH